MANLIIGHTTERSTTIWIRGDARHRHARITVRAAADGAFREEKQDLCPERDFAAAVSIGELRADTPYTVLARFAPSEIDFGEGRRVVSAEGCFRTFPEPGADRTFSFLHGSCNLSIVSLTNLGSLVLGALGLRVATRALERPSHGFWRWALEAGNLLAFPFLVAVFVLRFVWSSLRGGRRPDWPRWGDAILQTVFLLVYKRSGYKQPEPAFPSPFRELFERTGPATSPRKRPAFMIHAGDQIYFDFPFPERNPEHADYRLAYREAWFEDPALRAFLASCPHYMMLDDHEIVDAFALDRPGKRAPIEYLRPAMRAYREYVHSRHPAKADGALWYEFQYGSTHFFVLDTRTERRRATGCMLDEMQIGRFETWMKQRKDELKFVVSSVPFLAEMRSTRPDAGSGPDEKDDKWSGRIFRAQRDRILELVHAEHIGRLVFLVGDMHCSYHATMRIGAYEKRSTIHELAGGPIHQLEFTKRDNFHLDYRGATGGEKIPFRTFVRQFHGAAPGVLQVTVRPRQTPEVLWTVVRTSQSLGGLREPRPLTGQIAF